MKLIKVNNTYDLNLTGKPSTELSELSASEIFGLNPSRYDLKLRLLVKEGDSVKIGTPICQDKKDEAVLFLSPASGTIKTIEFGDRRIISKVIIESDSNNESVELFSAQSQSDIQSSTAQELAEKLQLGGLWQSFVAYPFQSIPKSSDLPPAIYVSLSNDEPFMPHISVVLSAYEKQFLLGLDVLKKLSKAVFVAKSDSEFIPETIIPHVTHEISGQYPANHPGVFIYHAKTSQEENKSWGISALEVVRIGQLFETGAYPIERIIVVAGALAKKPRHIKIREGVSLEFLKNEILSEEPVRIVAGGVLTGKAVLENDFLGAQDFAIHLLREGYEQELFTFFRPGFDKPTYGRTYLSTLINAENNMTTSLNGGERACISCGICPNVCPVDLYPQLIMKSLYANDVETAVSYGFLDCVQCGLCTHVCPSKIDMDVVFKQAKDNLLKEVNR
jgi:Na+-transporting NADH:ubiquinone oxidoreductase subunit A